MPVWSKPSASPISTGIRLRDSSTSRASSTSLLITRYTDIHAIKYGRVIRKKIGLSSKGSSQEKKNKLFSHSPDNDAVHPSGSANELRLLFTVSALA